MVDLRDFLFQKSYVDEMVMCLQAFAFTQCEETNIIQYWHEAKHLFSTDNVFTAMNKRCEKYNVEPFEKHEWVEFLHKIEHEWQEQIVMMVVMLTV